MVYAKADKRWAEADLTVISIELLTVIGAGPLALWICWGISRRDYRVAFWMIVLATGELYGGTHYTLFRSLFAETAVEKHKLIFGNRIHDLCA